MGAANTTISYCEKIVSAVIKLPQKENEETLMQQVNSLNTYEPWQKV